MYPPARASILWSENRGGILKKAAVCQSCTKKIAHLQLFHEVYIITHNDLVNRIDKRVQMFVVWVDFLGSLEERCRLRLGSLGSPEHQNAERHFHLCIEWGMRV